MLNKAGKQIIITIIGVLVISLLFVVFIDILSSHQSSYLIENEDQKIQTIKNIWEDTIVDAVGIIDATADLDEVRQKPDPKLIEVELNGAPKDAGLEKREVAQDILAGNPHFEDIGFMMPNGDVYVLEPYSHQNNLGTFNFAFRDYMVGALSTKETYVSEAFQSKGSKEKTLAISTPVFSDSKVVGVWVGALNLELLKDNIVRYTLLGDSSRMILVDHNANMVLDTHKNTTSNNGFSSFAYLQSINHALNGKSGYAEEKIDDVRMFSLYAPLHVGTHTWGILLTQPYDEVFSSVDFLKNIFYLLMILVISIFVTIRYFAIKNIRKNIGKETSIKPQIAKSSSKKWFAVITVIVVAFSMYVSFDLNLDERIFGTYQSMDVFNVQKDFEPKTRYYIQNLRGDTVDTWLAWHIIEGRTLSVTILGQEIASDEKLDVIKETLLSEETVEIEDHILHKGPQGQYSTYYLGWKGALDQVAKKQLAFHVPLDLEIIEPDKGIADITINLVKYRDADGYSGYTKSITDDNQILKSTITIYDVDKLSPNELATITRHELGHALGLAHSTAPEDLMHPTIQTNYPFISQCNIDALTTLYDGGQSSQVVCEK